MKKALKRLVAALLIITVLIAAPAAIAADAPDDAPSYHYVALGDSISSHFRVEKSQGYAEILADFLCSEPEYNGLRLTNLSKIGDDSTDILAMVDEYAEAIRGADLITISIGANNFLGLVINRVNSFISERNGSDRVYSYLEIDSGLIGEMAAALGGVGFLAEVAQGIQRLETDISDLIERLKALSPSADIYFMTIYNPLNESDAIFDIADMLITSANTKITENAGLGYTVVDVYGAFRGAGADGLTFIDLSAGSIDPHPNIKGHRVIAETHFKAITGKNLEIPEDYAPVTPLTRSEAVASICEGVYPFIPSVINSVFGGHAESGGFSDVPARHPFSRQINGARSIGLVNGVGNGFFLPEAYMTRQDYAVTLVRFCRILEERGFSLNLPGPANIYLTDIGDAAAYASDAVRRFAGSPLLPVAGGKVEPISPVTTAELAALKALIESVLSSY